MSAAAACAQSRGSGAGAMEAPKFVGSHEPYRAKKIRVCQAGWIEKYNKKNLSISARKAICYIK
jgi:hypothetical protein